MFNSKTIPTNKVEKTFIPVILTLGDGETLKGAIAIPKTRSLGDLLNGPDKYILFKTNAGEPIYLAQSTIAAVQSNEKPQARQLDKSLKQLQDLNPYYILKVKPGVDKTTVRTAYHKLVKHYHPDQFANTKLPREVASYLASVIQRLNAAYQEVNEEFDRLERIKQLATAPKKAPDKGTIHFFGQ